MTIPTITVISIQIRMQILTATNNNNTHRIFKAARKMGLVAEDIKNTIFSEIKSLNIMIIMPKKLTLI